MKTIVIVGGIILAGATMIAVMMDDRNDVPAASPAVQTESVSDNSALPMGNGTKVNPAHGQPGHRCDLAVGAPLDGNSSGSQPTIQAQPVLPSKQSSTEAPKGQKLNPAHGQPGHRCDLQIGAPLT